MRKLLLFFFALLTGVSGVRAASPNILAYPEAGKIYYMSAYYSGSEPATQAYIYYNGTQFAITKTAPSSGDFAYLWLCSKDGNNYRFQNMKSGKYLGHKGESKDSPFNFNLGKTVTNATCVTLYSISNSKYNVIKHSASTFDQADDNYHNSNFSSDFLFEEYAATILSHNQYYYIYCDNDNSDTSGDEVRQYVYNNDGTIAVQTTESSVTLSNYAWRAQKLSKDHFSFKNGTKYLAFHTLTDAAYDWNVNYVADRNELEKSHPYVTWLWGVNAARYMLFDKGNITSPNTGGKADRITSSISKTTSKWSPDFVFRIARQTDVYRVAIKIEGGYESNAVFTFDGIDYSGDCSIYVDNNNLPGTTNISLKSSNSEYTFKGFYLEDGTSLGTTIDVSALTANKGVKAVFYPFKLSTDFANANWYYMQVNGKYASTGGDGETCPLSDTKQVAQKGLWAFVSTTPASGFYLINYASGDEMKLDLDNTVIMNSIEHYNICHVKFDGDNMYFYNDPSSPYYLVTSSSQLGISSDYTNGAINLEAVDWAELAEAEIARYESIQEHYFGGVTTTSFNNVKTMAEAVSSLSDYNTFISGYASFLSVKNAPETGYYRIKNKLTTGEYGYIGVSGTSADEKIYLKGNISNVNDASTIIHITKDGTGKYNFQTQGKYIRNVRKDEKSYLIDNAPSENFAMTAQSPGYGVIRTWADGDYSHLHAASGNSYYIVGWENAADASQWVIVDATSININMTTVDGKSYATVYLPFPVSAVSGATAYKLSVSKTYASATEIAAFPAGTGVLLVSDDNNSTATLTIGGTPAAVEGNALTGHYLAGNEADAYVFANGGNGLGFYPLDSEHTNIAANKAFIRSASIPSNVKGLTLEFGDVDGINSIDNGQRTMDNVAIYNIAGQRVAKAQKGLYIVNGKKVVIK